MAIKSAIMTTAYQTTRSGFSQGQEFGKPFDFGAGHVDPTAALQPGLVLDSSNSDWQRFICGSGEINLERCPAECQTNASLCELINLNTPVILVARLASSKAVTRTLTSVLTVPATFTVSNIVRPAGFEVAVQPSSFNLNPGGSIVVQVNISWVAGVEFQQYKDGSITWTSDQNTTTRIPVVVSASYLAAPPELRIHSRAPTLTYTVTPGFTGNLSTVVMGLQEARVSQGKVYQDPRRIFNREDPTNQNAAAVAISLPAAQSRYVRVALFTSDYPEGTDLDLFVYNSKSEHMLGKSMGTISDELFSLENPTETGLTVYIHGAFVPGGNVTYKLYVWMLDQSGPASSNAMSTPASNRPLRVTSGSPAAVTLSFNNRLLASSSQKWLGIVRYAGDAVDDGKVGLVPLPQYDTVVNL
eukprot:gene12299-12435_t